MSDPRATNALELPLARLRQEFDSGFAEPVRTGEERLDQLLCFSAGGAGFAIPLSGLQSVVRCTALTPIAARAPALLGLSVVRAQIVAVYSLARLTGIGSQTIDSHWLLLLHGPGPVALALDSLDGYVLETAMQPAAGQAASPLIAGLIKHHGKIYAAVDAAQIYNAMARMDAGNERDT